MAEVSNAAKWRLFAIVGVLSTIADQLTKIWARGSLPTLGQSTGGGCLPPTPADWLPDATHHVHCYGDTVNVIKGFWTWRLSMNPGSAFGLFGGLAVGRVLLSAVGVAAVIGMFVMMWKSRNNQRILHWALALVAGGAIGNLIDRIHTGLVTDFISWDLKFMVWPTFNVADIVLVAGVILMFIDIQIEGKVVKAAKLERKLEREKKAKAAGLVKDLEA
ncbi:MAG: signal peptidase II [Kofleriaceae bacterium]